MQKQEHIHAIFNGWLAIGLMAGYVLGLASTVLFSCLFSSKTKSRAYREITTGHVPSTGAGVHSPLSQQRGAWQGGGGPAQSQQPPNICYGSNAAAHLQQATWQPEQQQQQLQQGEGAFVVKVNDTAAPRGNSGRGVETACPALGSRHVSQIPEDGPYMQQTTSGRDGSAACPDEGLDDDWRALLSDLDELLAKQGASRMSAQERGAAIKQVIQCTGSRGPAQALAAVRDIILRARPGVAAGPAPQQQGTAAGRPQHAHQRTASGLQIEDSYLDDELDDDWKALLSELDALLVEKGAARLSSQERSTAIRKLVECTGTRGPTFALAAARDAVLRGRCHNPFS